jgi:hypothetical protein
MIHPNAPIIKSVTIFFFNLLASVINQWTFTNKDTLCGTVTSLRKGILRRVRQKNQRQMILMMSLKGKNWTILSAGFHLTHDVTCCQKLSWSKVVMGDFSNPVLPKKTERCTSKSNLNNFVIFRTLQFGKK